MINDEMLKVKSNDYNINNNIKRDSKKEYKKLFKRIDKDYKEFLETLIIDEILEADEN